MGLCELIAPSAQTAIGKKMNAFFNKKKQNLFRA